MLGFSFRHYRFVNFEEERALFIKKFSRLGESGEQELVDSKDDLPPNEVFDEKSIGEHCVYIQPFVFSDLCVVGEPTSEGEIPPFIER